ncbi:ribonuclease HI [Rathayibacter sp. AY1A2]|uniref:ribonuclease HI n=1 Tax=Rathayibacter sp. AY1A2 TaxID=2080520 RepID=UPI0021574DBC|nr:RNase H family protein [Rathayibacter sp. AY1A2]
MGIGEIGLHAAKCASSFHAELIAIDEATRAQPQFTRVKLLVDSQCAVDAVTLVLANPPQRRERLDVIERRLHSIVNAAANREVVLRWVRGHDGHPLNDAADRIAVLMRRSFAWGTSRDVVADLARSIAEAGAAIFTSSSDGDER